MKNDAGSFPEGRRPPSTWALVPPIRPHHTKPQPQRLTGANGEKLMCVTSLLLELTGHRLHGAVPMAPPPRTPPVSMLQKLSTSKHRMLPPPVPDPVAPGPQRTLPCAIEGLSSLPGEATEGTVTPFRASLHPRPPARLCWRLRGGSSPARFGVRVRGALPLLPEQKGGSASGDISPSTPEAGAAGVSRFADVSVETARHPCCVGNN